MLVGALFLQISKARHTVALPSLASNKFADCYKFVKSPVAEIATPVPRTGADLKNIDMSITQTFAKISGNLKAKVYGNRSFSSQDFLQFFDRFDGYEV